MYSEQYYIQQGNSTGSLVKLAQSVHFRDDENRWCQIIKVGSKYVRWQYMYEGRHDYKYDEKKEISGFLMNFVTNKFRLIPTQVDYVPVYVGMKILKRDVDFVSWRDEKGMYNSYSEEVCEVVKLFGNGSQCPVCRTIKLKRGRRYINGDTTPLKEIPTSPVNWLLNSDADQFGNIKNCLVL